MAKMTSLEDPKLKRIAIARDVLVGCPPGPLPLDEYHRELKKHGITPPKQRQTYDDLKDARELMAKMPETAEVKSWLSHLMIYLTSKSYKSGKYQSAIAGGKLLAELTGALAPPQEQDRSVDIARYLQDSRFVRRAGDGVEDDLGGSPGEVGAAAAEGGEGSAGQAVSEN